MGEITQQPDQLVLSDQSEVVPSTTSSIFHNVSKQKKIVLTVVCMSVVGVILSTFAYVRFFPKKSSSFVSSPAPIQSVIDSTQEQSLVQVMQTSVGKINISNPFQSQGSRVNPRTYALPSTIIQRSSKESPQYIIDPKIELQELKGKQSSLFSQVYAAVQETETIAIIPSYAGSYTKEELAQIGAKFGFTTSPTKPTQFADYEWKNESDSLHTMGSNGSAYFHSMPPKDGELPSAEEAKGFAQKFLIDHHLIDSSENVLFDVGPKHQTTLFNDYYSKDSPNYQTYTEVIPVAVQTKVKNLPLTTGMFMKNGTELTSPRFNIEVGKGGHIVFVADASIGYTYREDEALMMAKKSLQDASAEVATTGGSVRWIEPVPGKGYSSAEKLEVRDGVITEARLVYRRNTSTLNSYTEGKKWFSGYLVPEWIFIGRGKVYSQSYQGEELGFATAVSAWKELSPSAHAVIALTNRSLGIEQGVYKPKSSISLRISLGDVDPAATRPYFNFSTATVGYPYRLTVQYPDGGTLEQINIIREFDGDVLTVPTRDQEGVLRVTVQLLDVPSEKYVRTLHVCSKECPDIRKENSLLLVQLMAEDTKMASGGGRTYLEIINDKRGIFDECVYDINQPCQQQNPATNKNLSYEYISQFFYENMQKRYVATQGNKNPIKLHAVGPFIVDRAMLNQNVTVESLKEILKKNGINSDSYNMVGYVYFDDHQIRSLEENREVPQAFSSQVLDYKTFIINDDNVVAPFNAHYTITAIAHHIGLLFGATSKRTATSSWCQIPQGLGDPSVVPLFPQRTADLFCGIVYTQDPSVSGLGGDSFQASMNRGEVVINSYSAEEMGL